MKWFSRKPKMTGYIYQGSYHTGWGDSINWSDYPKRQMVGWLQRRPEKGDEIRMEMKSGKIARYVVLEVEHCSNPDDMWFASVMDIGYVGEKPINPIREAQETQIEPKRGISFLR